MSGISTARTNYVGGRCTLDPILHTRTFIFSTFFTDIVFLVLMLSGIRRWRDLRRGGGIWSLLYKQSLLWVVIFTFAGVPPLISIISNLNGPFSEDIMNQMFIVPAVVLMTICASRMYLGLVNSTSLNQSPLGAVAVTEFKARVGFPAPSHHGHLTDDTYNTGGQLPALNVLTDISHQEFFGASLIID
ncbi:hypothetical protein F5148DRAFT_1377172 [Russula earlei]|uniref:Uncharacterized protein n=1 Tax=Russula earlei TaxID=71964 RepID=A0ACC0U5I6_9AGAM|nr:hypothetical protein F5148DRAFT_1377172 [Russula earlei]